MSEEKPTKQPKLRGLKLRDIQGEHAGAKSYSRIVWTLRWILPSAALLGLVTLIVWPMIAQEKLAAIAVKQIPNLVVDNLHLTGMDGDNQAYSLSAERALQSKDPEAQGSFDLENPEAEITLKDGSWLAGQASIGRFNQEQKKLWLGGKVEFFHDDGTNFSSDEMNIDLNENIAWGEKPVLIHGSFGEITGERFRLLEGGKVFIIKGKSKARLDMTPQKEEKTKKKAPKDKPSGKNLTSE